jgi:hypothetical protein
MTLAKFIYKVRGCTGDFPARKSKINSWVPHTKKETKKTSKPRNQQ